MGGRHWAVGVVLVVGCFSRAQYDRAHEQRVATIDERYDRLEAEESERWNALLKLADERRSHLAKIEPGNGYHPVDRVDRGEGFVTLETTCVRVANQAKAASSSPSPELEKVASECVQKLVWEIYVPALQARYWKADSAWAIGEWQAARFTSDVESLFAFSHNRALLAEIEAASAQVIAARDRALADLRRMRAAQVAQSAEHRDAEVAAAQDRHRRQLAAIGAGLSAIGQSMQNANTPSHPGTQAVSAAQECSSDFVCGVGFTCVKPLYGSTGYCAKAVNDYGVQTFDAPRLDSVGPNMRINTSCMNLGCPGGFSCDLKSGVCLR